MTINDHSLTHSDNDTMWIYHFFDCAGLFLGNIGCCSFILVSSTICVLSTRNDLGKSTQIGSGHFRLLIRGLCEGDHFFVAYKYFFLFPFVPVFHVFNTG